MAGTDIPMNLFNACFLQYGGSWAISQFPVITKRLRLLFAALALFAAPAPLSAASPIQMVVLGDSLSAGYLLPQDAAFPAVLERALRAEGLAIEIMNAGVSGDTSRGGLERLDWAVPEGTQAVLLELGANDMLRGIDPARTKEALDTIITRLKARGVRVFLAGMLASPSLGKDYGERFNAIYPELAKKHAIPLYPFFLAGVAGDRALNLDDGMHPNRKGVETIVQAILPSVKSFLSGM
jgi:acyl-CoA thioesterase-1